MSDWSGVLSVRVTVTLESQDDNVSDVSRSFTLGNGTVVTDRRLRRTMTFGLRKRRHERPPPSLTSPGRQRGIVLATGCCWCWSR